MNTPAEVRQVANRDYGYYSECCRDWSNAQQREFELLESLREQQPSRENHKLQIIQMKRLAVAARWAILYREIAIDITRILA